MKNSKKYSNVHYNIKSNRFSANSSPPNINRKKEKDNKKLIL